MIACFLLCSGKEKQMHLLTMRRAGWRVSALLLVLAVIVAGASLTAWRLTQAPQRQVQPGRVIDWQHPVRIPGPGMALSGVGSPATGDIYTPLVHTGSNAQAIAPQADFPRCWGNVYMIKVGGVEFWAKT